MIAKTVLTRWRANPINFIQQVLINPETNRPFVLLEAERAFLTYAFTLGADGRLLYPEQVYALSEKVGENDVCRDLCHHGGVVVRWSLSGSHLRGQRLRSIRWARLRCNQKNY